MVNSPNKPEMRNATDLPKVTVLLPCRNEGGNIGALLQQLIQQTYPQELLEILVIDGESTDNTADVVLSFSEKYPHIKLVPNPDRFVSNGANNALELAHGAYVFLLGAHAEYPKNYFEDLIALAEEHHADLVGGVLAVRPSESSPSGIVLAEVLSHPFGIGNSSFRVGVDCVKAADTAVFGCYRRDVFERFGNFDERLVRNQDMELSKRIVNGGGKILITPNVSSTYLCRSTFHGVFKNNYENGLYVFLTAFYTSQLSALSFRHYIPFLFVLYLLSLPIIYAMGVIVFIPLLVYLALNIWFSAKSAKNQKSLFAFPRFFVGFLGLHISYGVGTLFGLIKCLKLSFFQITKRESIV